MNVNKILFLFVLCLIFLMPKTVFAISQEQEIEIGRQAGAKIELQYGLWQNAREFNRLNRIGRAIAAISERPNLPYTFKILNTDALNALACPGGFIYVTKGTMNNATDGELAFVLGHEIAHVAKRHSIKHMEKEAATKTGLLVLSSLFSKGQVNQGNINMISAVNTVLSSGYSREDERDADITACHYMLRGVNANPRAAVSFMEKLKKSGKEMPEFMNNIIGDHPRTDERIKTLDEECRKLGY